MRQTKFAYFLNKFFTFYLPNVNGCSSTTIDSYRYAFIQLLTYFDSINISATNFELTDLTRKNISDYLIWLQNEKKNSASTRNQRQAAINSFVHYLTYETPEYIYEFQKILSIPVKKVNRKSVSYLKTDGVRLLLQQVDTSKTTGVRDLAILAIMYSTGIRVSELINIRVKDVSLSEPPTLLVHGKNHKSRYVPLVNNTIQVLNDYINVNSLYEEKQQTRWLFINHLGTQFSRQGINYIVKKYGDKARDVDSNLIPLDLSPHKIRHTTAMELVEEGVDLIYIRDLLGHASVKTTEIYGKAQAAGKRKAIEAASKDIVVSEPAKWEENISLIDWLKSFNR